MSGRRAGVLGRRAARFRLEDSRISREHAEASVDNGVWRLRDLRSTNGTYLNGNRVTSPAILSQGDRVQIGRIVLEVVQADLGPATAAKTQNPLGPDADLLVIDDGLPPLEPGPDPAADVLDDEVMGSGVALETSPDAAEDSAFDLDAALAGELPQSEQSPAGDADLEDILEIEAFEEPLETSDASDSSDLLEIEDLASDPDPAQGGGILDLSAFEEDDEDQADALIVALDDESADASDDASSEPIDIADPLDASAESDVEMAVEPTSPQAPEQEPEELQAATESQEPEESAEIELEGIDFELDETEPDAEDEDSPPSLVGLTLDRPAPETVAAPVESDDIADDVDVVAEAQSSPESQPDLAEEVEDSRPDEASEDALVTQETSASEEDVFDLEQLALPDLEDSDDSDDSDALDPAEISALALLADAEELIDDGDEVVVEQAHEPSEPSQDALSGLAQTGEAEDDFELESESEAEAKRPDAPDALVEQEPASAIEDSEILDLSDAIQLDQDLELDLSLDDEPNLESDVALALDLSDDAADSPAPDVQDDSSAAMASVETTDEQDAADATESTGPTERASESLLEQEPEAPAETDTEAEIEPEVEAEQEPRSSSPDAELNIAVDLTASEELNDLDASAEPADVSLEVQSDAELDDDIDFLEALAVSPAADDDDAFDALMAFDEDDDESHAPDDGPESADASASTPPSADSVSSPAAGSSGDQAAGLRALFQGENQDAPSDSDDHLAPPTAEPTTPVPKAQASSPHAATPSTTTPTDPPATRPVLSVLGGDLESAPRHEHRGRRSHAVRRRRILGTLLFVAVAGVAVSAAGYLAYTAGMFNAPPQAVQAPVTNATSEQVSAQSLTSTTWESTASEPLDLFDDAPSVFNQAVLQLRPESSPSRVGDSQDPTKPSADAASSLIPVNTTRQAAGDATERQPSNGTRDPTPRPATQDPDATSPDPSLSVPPLDEVVKDSAPQANPAAVPTRRTVQMPAPTGPKVVFLVDASGTLIDTIHQAVAWLDIALEQLDTDRRFTVILFRKDQAIEAADSGLKPADPQHIAVVQKWLDPRLGNIDPVGQSNIAQALERALAYEPDTLYLLSDNKFGRTPDEDAAAVRRQFASALSDQGVTLHTVQFVYRDPENLLESLAAEHGGEYVFVKEPGREIRVRLVDPADLLAQ